METISHECYVSLEVAKLLKEAGFGWRCRAAYRDGILVFQENSLYDNFNGKQYENGTSHEFFSAPTLDVAQRWLREVKKCYINIILRENKHSVTNWDGCTFHYEYDEPTFDCEIKNIKGETIYIFDDTYTTYEEAQEAGNNKAFELI